MLDETQVETKTAWKRYIVDKEIGCGSYGIVYLCHDANAGFKHVAVKVIPLLSLEEDEVNFAMNEAAILKGMWQAGDTAHILSCSDSFIDEEGQLCLVTEFVEGGDLSALLQIFRTSWPELADYGKIRDCFDREQISDDEAALVSPLSKNKNNSCAASASELGRERLSPEGNYVELDNAAQRASECGCAQESRFSSIPLPPRCYLDEGVLVEIIRQVLLGLHTLRRLRVAHCDIKTANLLFSPAVRKCVSLSNRNPDGSWCAKPYSGGGDEFCVKIGDFGTARIPSQLSGLDAPSCRSPCGTPGRVRAGTYKRAVIGTPHFMSPEICASRCVLEGSVSSSRQSLTISGIDPFAGDVWAAGVVFFELFTLKLPFHKFNNIILLFAAIAEGSFDRSLLLDRCYYYSDHRGELGHSADEIVSSREPLCLFISDIIVSMLTVDPLKRPSPAFLLKYYFNTDVPPTVSARSSIASQGTTSEEHTAAFRTSTVTALSDAVACASREDSRSDFKEMIRNTEILPLSAAALGDVERFDTSSTPSPFPHLAGADILSQLNVDDIDGGSQGLLVIPSLAESPGQKQINGVPPSKVIEAVLESPIRRRKLGREAVRRESGCDTQVVNMGKQTSLYDERHQDSAVRSSAGVTQETPRKFHKTNNALQVPPPLFTSFASMTQRPMVFDSSAIYSFPPPPVQELQQLAEYRFPTSVLPKAEHPLVLPVAAKPVGDPEGLRAQLLRYAERMRVLIDKDNKRYQRLHAQRVKNAEVAKLMHIHSSNINSGCSKYNLNLEKPVLFSVDARGAVPIGCGQLFADSSCAFLNDSSTKCQDSPNCASTLAFIASRTLPLSGNCAFLAQSSGEEFSNREAKLTAAAHARELRRAFLIKRTYTSSMQHAVSTDDEMIDPRLFCILIVPRLRAVLRVKGLRRSTPVARVAARLQRVLKVKENTNTLQLNAFKLLYFDTFLTVGGETALCTDPTSEAYYCSGSDGSFGLFDLVANLHVRFNTIKKVKPCIEIVKVNSPSAWEYVVLRELRHRGYEEPITQLEGSNIKRYKARPLILLSEI